MSQIQPSSKALELGRQVLRIEAEAVLALSDRINGSFLQALTLILNCHGRVIVSGIGKSGHVGRKIAATLASTGTPAFFVHPAEASHGDLGMITAEDVVIGISNSGESAELLNILPSIKRQGAKLIAMTGNEKSSLSRDADVHLDAGVAQEACPLNLAPTASTTAALALGDALAVALLDARGFGAEDFARSHPGGSLGRRLLTRMRDVMRSGSELPRVQAHDDFFTLMREMSAKNLGAAIIVDANNHVLGIFTDGDLRRLIDRQQGFDVNLPVSEVMIQHPSTISKEARAVEALEQMNAKKINQFVVVDDAQRVIGVISMHDLIQAGVN